MADKVSFDGLNKLIIVNYGEDELDAESDIYSAWKRWLIQETEKGTVKWTQALRTTGGDPIGGTQTISPFFFLVNGWRLRPYEGDHRLVVDGNLFAESGNPFVPTVGSYNVLIELRTSSKSITDTISVSGGGGLTQAQSDQLFSLPVEGIIADAVWDEKLVEHLTSGSAGELVTKIKKLVSLIPAGV